MSGPRQSARLAAKAEARAATVTNDATAPQGAVASHTSMQGKKRAVSSTTSVTSQTKAASKKPTRARKKRKTNLAHGVSTQKPAGIVDPDSGLHGSIVPHASDSFAMDAMLVFIEPKLFSDKFYVLQCIQVDDPPQGEEFAVYRRWGRTGTRGSGMVDFFSEEHDAVTAFDKLFEEKSGLRWADRDESAVDGKYRNIKLDFDAKSNDYMSAVWQYWVDDGVDGKATGWYPYDEQGTKFMEECYTAYMMQQDMSTRYVASGNWTYHVDYTTMTQTNATHPSHTSRHIRRVPPGTVPSNTPPTTPLQPASEATVPAFNVSVPPTVLPAQKAVKASAKRSTKKKPQHNVSKPPPATVKTDTAPTTKAEPKTEDKTDAPKPRVYVVDGAISITPHAPTDFEVVEDYDATLNQCNITMGNNNNKYYRLQVLKEKSSSRYRVWNRWGRVGENVVASQTRLFGPFQDLTQATKMFRSKYSSKTGNSWDKRDDFKSKPGKYEPILIDATAEIPDDMPDLPKRQNIKYEDSKLDAKTLDLVQVLFNQDMMTDALQQMNIDIKRMPLGALDIAQVQRGIDALDEIKSALASGGADLAALSSRFYTMIPHSFGRSRPPVISNEAMLQQKYDMCDILSDVVSTKAKVEKREKEEAKVETKVLPHPADTHYDSMNAKLELVDRNSEEFGVVERYFEATKRNGCKLLDVWKVDRATEGARFSSHNDIETRRLLWHGTGIEVVAAILSSGLRIMPHSGGRVGKGLYLASEQAKSACYTRQWGNKYGCMFLAEAAIGKSFEITRDDPSLTMAPKGYDSVLAKGTQTPVNTVVDIDIEGKTVGVPQGAPSPSGVQSSFHQDEFLIYRESQARLRYVITVKLY